MILTNIKLTATVAAIAAIIASMLYLHSSTLEAGKAQARLECQQENLQQLAKAEQKIQELETALTTAAQVGQQKQKDLAKYIKQAKTKLISEPVVVVENGKCIPATNFLDSINKAISKANQE